MLGWVGLVLAGWWVGCISIIEANLQPIEKCPILRPKIPVLLNSYLIASWLVEFFKISSFDCCSIPLSQSKFENFEFIKNDRSILTYSLFLFNSSQSLLKTHTHTHTHTKSLFLSQSFRGFHFLYLVWLFYPSFLIKLHIFMHNHSFSLKISNSNILGFSMILGVLS